MGQEIVRGDVENTSPSPSNGVMLPSKSGHSSPISNSIVSSVPSVKSMARAYVPSPGGESENSVRLIDVADPFSGREPPVGNTRSTLASSPVASTSADSAQNRWGTGSPEERTKRLAATPPLMILASTMLAPYSGSPDTLSPEVTGKMSGE